MSISKRNRLSVALPFATLVLLLIFASCDLLPLGDDPLYPSANVAVEAGIGRLSTLAYGQTPEDINRVEVIVTGEDVFGVLHDTFADPLTTIELSLTGTIWSGVVPSLPVGPDLVFHVFAYDSTDTLIYEGVSPPTVVSAGGTSIVIPLSPYLAPGEVILFPVIQSIMRPAEIVRNTDATVTVGLKGQPGETLDLSATSGGGLFVPALTSEITGAGGLASVALIYSAPDTVGTYPHTVKVENEQGNSVETGFSTTVVYDTGDVEVAISYAPSITGLHTRRDGDTISWEAEVSDDGPGPFTFLWDFDGGLSFTDATTNPAFLEGYDETVTGTMSLTVTDSDGLSTTIQFLLPVGQFPDVLVAEPTGSGFANKSWSVPTKIELEDGGDTSGHQIAMDDEGNAIAIWIYYDGSRTILMSNRYTGSWGVPQAVDSAVNGFSYWPQIAMNSNGSAIAVWTQFDGSALNVFANVYSPTSGWGTPVSIETGTGDAYDPQVGVDPSGNAIAVWEQKNGSTRNIKANRFIAGQGWGIEENIEQLIINAFRPQVGIDDTGNAIAIWQQADATHINVWANRYVVGLGWEAAEIMETEMIDAAVEPQIAVGPDGNAIAVWRRSDAGGSSARSRDYIAGSGWSAPVSLDSASTFNVTNLQIELNAGGNAIASWSGYDGPWTYIFTQLFDTVTGWGVSEKISSETPTQHQIALDPTGNAVAVWTSYNGLSNVIWSNIYSPSPGWGTDEPVIPGIDGAENAPKIQINADGDAVMIWRAYDGTRYDVWASTRS